MKSKKIALIILLCIFFFVNNKVFAGFADYTDEDADKETKQMIQEHQEQFDSTKSDNCFLKELSIQNGVLYPNFDRQIINYVVNIKKDINEINIIANPEDDRAKVVGKGKINIKDIAECKIDVVAESGTTKTYVIKINREDNIETKESENVLVANEVEQTKNDINIDKTEQIENESSVDVINNIEIYNIVENEKNNSSQINKVKHYILIGVIIIVIFIICILVFINKYKNNKY